MEQWHPAFRAPHGSENLAVGEQWPVILSHLPLLPNSQALFGGLESGCTPSHHMARFGLSHVPSQLARSWARIRIGLMNSWIGVGLYLLPLNSWFGAGSWLLPPTRAGWGCSTTCGQAGSSPLCTHSWIELILTHSVQLNGTLLCLPWAWMRATGQIQPPQMDGALPT